MSTVKKPDITTTSVDNKKLFGPLGKYAIIGVIMGSIIVTTAIMLDRQPDSEEHIAAIEKELADMNAASGTESANQATAGKDEIAAETIVTPAETAIAAIQATATAASETNTTDHADADATTVNTAEAAIDTVVTVAEPAANSIQTNEHVAAVSKVKAEAPGIDNIRAALPQEAVVNDTVETPQAKFAIGSYDKEWQASIEADELEYKQHLAEYFNQIKSRESEHLERYKKHQNEHIDFLRDQISRQEKIIDDLISRNKEYYDTQKTTMRHRQSRREAMLNRI